LHHPVAVHDERNERKEDFEHYLTRLERDKLRAENDALLQDKERLLREQERMTSAQEKDRMLREQEKDRMLREQEKDRILQERMMRRDRGRLDRWPYMEPIFPEPRHHAPRSQRFSRDLESSRFPF
jgi:hypothetical protein